MTSSKTAARVTVRLAQPDDCRQIWEWRNEPGMREASFNSDPVALEDHTRWFAKVLAADDIRLFVGLSDGRGVGFVRFDRHGSEAHVSVTIDRDLRGRGLGSELIREACRVYLAAVTSIAVVALIRRSNAPSQTAFAKAGFVTAGPREVNGIDAVQMVLP
jgi:L-amino acid N-acyltransferase YncA